MNRSRDSTGVGMASLPFRIPVEIECEVAIRL
jgi:hypothetical protein